MSTKITASAFNTNITNVINSTMTRYSITAVTAVTANTLISKARIDDIRARFTTLNTHARNTAGTQSLANVVATTTTKIATSLTTEILRLNGIYFNSYCSCHCNFCSCNCNFCSCDCNYCSCNCNHCSCVSHCSCNCNHCTCNCDQCYCQSNLSPLPPGLGHFYTCPCLPPDAKIITSRGMVEIRNIAEGDYVLSGDGAFNEVYTKWVSAPIVTDKLVTLIGEGYNQPVTSCHVIYLYNQNLKEIEKIPAHELLSLEINNYYALIPHIKNEDIFKDGKFMYNRDVVFDLDVLHLIAVFIKGGMDVTLNYDKEALESIFSILDKYRFFYDYRDNLLMLEFEDGFMINTDTSIKKIYEYLSKIQNWVLKLSHEQIEQFLEILFNGFDSVYIPNEHNREMLYLLALKIGRMVTFKNEVASISNVQYTILEENGVSYTLLPIKDITIEDFTGEVYNLAINGVSSYVGSILMGDSTI
jgi:hypothetical protein